jgi:hypothetical protein
VTAVAARVIDAKWLRRANLGAFLYLLERLQARRHLDDLLDPARARRRFSAERGWALRKGEFERYLGYFGSHERLSAFSRIAERIRDDATYWRCLRETWTGDDAPSLASGMWAALWAARPGREQVMTPEERGMLAALPDPIRVWRGTARLGDDAGWSWTTDPARAVWFAGCNADNVRVRKLYGVRAQGTPMVLEGLVARDRILAMLHDRGEAEIVVPFAAVHIEQTLPFAEAAEEWEGWYDPMPGMNPTDSPPLGTFRGTPPGIAVLWEE